MFCIFVCCAPNDGDEAADDGVGLNTNELLKLNGGGVIIALGVIIGNIGADCDDAMLSMDGVIIGTVVDCGPIDGDGGTEVDPPPLPKDIKRTLCDVFNCV